MTGTLRIIDGRYYVRLNLKDESGKRKQPSIPLDIDAVPGNVKEWMKARTDLQPDTVESYEFSIKVHLYPYFQALNLHLQDVEYWYIADYYAEKGKTLSVNGLKKHHASRKATSKEIF